MALRLTQSDGSQVVLQVCRQRIIALVKLLHSQTMNSQNVQRFYSGPHNCSCITWPAIIINYRVYPDSVNNGISSEHAWISSSKPLSPETRLKLVLTNKNAIRGGPACSCARPLLCPSLYKFASFASQKNALTISSASNNKKLRVTYADF
jgi:hypothetical protein